MKSKRGKEGRERRDERRKDGFSLTINMAFFRGVLLFAVFPLLFFSFIFIWGFDCV